MLTSLTELVQHLKSVPLISLNSARQELIKYHHYGEYYNLTKHYFPSTFDQSSLETLGTHSIKPDEGFIQIKMIFLRLFHENILPINIYYDFDEIEEETNEYVGHHIPIICMNYDWCSEYGWDTNKSHEILIAMAQETEITKEELKGLFPVIPDFHLEPNWSKFRQLVSAIPQLFALHDSLAIVTFNTGNPFLDQFPESEDITCFQWCVRDINVLKEYYREAIQLMNSLDALCNWLDEDDSNIATMVHFYNQSANNNS